MEAPPRFELGVKALQARALPLGHGAILNYIILMDKICKRRLASFAYIGAEDEIRTRDVHLGKVTLYH